MIGCPQPPYRLLGGNFQQVPANRTCATEPVLQLALDPPRAMQTAEALADANTTYLSGSRTDPRG